ncbi:DUF3291 domain-containing protein [Streptomyces aidingensis]|uniref:DUF3291 domain-containing protein n=1 Tax=Streptomyces aidingensis TaxID=910347 RepID=A0A1I1LP68_9ACTN|nr:DUF3291 domain-containing protein [Streptomyces aidingensis]SFC74342.1 protein of unknown function [Streptomyces aidingensis]
MSGFHLAQVNIARLAAPLDSPQLADFVAHLPQINELAERSPGFVWRMVDEDGADATGLRPDRTDDMLLINCSLWESVESLHAYTYRTDHLRLLSRRREWFEAPDGPHQALWWVPAGHHPTVTEAMDRVAHLRHHGPTPHAFTFRKHFPAPSSTPDGRTPGTDRAGSPATAP